MASNNFINECKNRGFKNRLANIEIQNETPITNSDYLQDIVVEDACITNGNILGSTFVKSLNMNLIDDNVSQNLLDKIIYPQIGVRYADNSTEFINMGKYTIERPINEQTANMAKIIAYDDFNKLDRKYICNLDFDNNEITIADFYIDVCSQLGLTPKTTTFINSNLVIPGNPFTNNETLRFVLSDIEEVACSFSEIDFDTNEIDLVWLSDSQEPDYVFNTSDYATLKGGQIQYGPVNSLVIRDSQIEGENVSRSDSESIEEDGLTEIVIADNYFLYTEELRSQAINGIWQRIKGLTYIDYELETYYGKPFLKCGSKIGINTNENNYFESYVLTHQFKYDGSFYSKLSAPMLTKQETAMKNELSIENRVKRAERITDKIKGQIEDIIEEQTDQSERISRVTQNLEGFEQTVSTTYETKTDATSKLNTAKTYAEGQASSAETNAISTANANTDTKINNIKIGGENLLRDTQNFGRKGVSENTMGYLMNFNSTIDTNTYQNFKVRTLTSSNAGDPMCRYYIDNCKNSEQYTASFYAKGEGSLRTYFYGPEGYIGCKIEGNVVQSDGQVNIQLTSEWKRYSITWTLKDTGGTTDVKYLLFRNDNLSTSWSMCGLKLEKGNKATEWSPSPFDYSTTVEMNSAIVQKANEITSTVSETYITKTDSATNIATAKSEAISSANSSTDTKLQNYTNTTDMNTAIGTAENNAKTYADGKASTAENNAKTYADGVSSTAETNAKNYTDSELDNITNTIDETTGKSFYIENAQNEKPIEMEFYGDTEQNTYGGKNLFDKNNTYWNKAGTTLSLLDTGVRATLNSAATYRYGVITIPNSDNLLGKTVTLSFTKNESGNNVGLVRLYSLDSSGNPITSYTSQSNFTANLPSSYTGNATQFGLIFYSNVNGTDVSIGDYVDYTNVQLEQGSTATSYEKYVGGTPSPNSDYPQNIEVVTGRQEINVVGKNILKNTLDILKTNNQSGTWNDNVYTYNGITFTYNNDGSITANGTTTNNISRLYISRTGNFEYTTLLAGTYYITSNETTGSNSTWKMQYGIDGKTYNVFGNGSSKEATVNLTNNSDVNGYIYIYANQTINNITFYPMISTKSNIEYEPYNGKSYEINLGKNLYDSSFRKSNNQIHTTNCNATEENGIFTLTATNTDMYIWQVINSGNSYSEIAGQLYELESDSYIVSISNDLFKKNFVTFYDENKVSLGYVSKLSNVFSFSKTTKTGAKYFSLRIGYSPATIGESYSYTIQLEKGTQATIYSPYKTPIELCKIVNYQDRIYKSNNKWYIEKQIGKVVLDGSEDWNYTSGSTQPFRLMISNIKQITTNDNPLLICSHFSNFIWSVSSKPDYGITQNVSTIAIRNKDNLTNLNEFKDWLSTHNIIVYYVLAEPTEEPIIDEELINQLNSFELMTGINNISINSNDLAADMYLKYYLHTPISDTYVNKVELNSQLKITSESISSEVNATYETKTDATSKLGEAKGYTDNQLTSYSTTTQMNSAITQKADEITQSVSQTYTTLDVTGGLSERVGAAEISLTTQGAKLNIISKNIDSTTGDIKSVKTLKGFTLDDEGFKIATSESVFNSLSNETGTYYKDGDTILTQFTKDNSITKDLVLYGTYYYGVDKDLDVSNFTKDDAMFVAEKFTDNNNEIGFGHFYNGGD